MSLMEPMMGVALWKWALSGMALVVLALAALEWRSIQQMKTATIAEMENYLKWNWVIPVVAASVAVAALLMTLYFAAQTPQQRTPLLLQQQPQQ